MPSEVLWNQIDACVWCMWYTPVQHVARGDGSTELVLPQLTARPADEGQVEITAWRTLTKLFTGSMTTSSFSEFTSSDALLQRCSICDDGDCDSAATSATLSSSSSASAGAGSAGGCAGRHSDDGVLKQQSSTCGKPHRHVYSCHQAAIVDMDRLLDKGLLPKLWLAVPPPCCLPKFRHNPAEVAKVLPAGTILCSTVFVNGIVLVPESVLSCCDGTATTCEPVRCFDVPLATDAVATVRSILRRHRDAVAPRRRGNVVTLYHGTRPSLVPRCCLVLSCLPGCCLVLSCLPGCCLVLSCLPG